MSLFKTINNVIKQFQKEVGTEVELKSTAINEYSAEKAANSGSTTNPVILEDPEKSISTKRQIRKEVMAELGMNLKEFLIRYGEDAEFAAASEARFKEKQDKLIEEFQNAKAIEAKKAKAFINSKADRKKGWEVVFDANQPMGKRKLFYGMLTDRSRSDLKYVTTMDFQMAKLRLEHLK